MWVDDVALATVAADLASAGASVHDQAGQLGLAPDAGRSSDETTRALGGLATTVAGVAEHPTRKNVDELTDRLEAVGRAVESFAGELDVVRPAMADARARSGRAVPSRLARRPQRAPGVARGSAPRPAARSAR